MTSQLVPDLDYGYLCALRHTHFFISTEGWYLKWWYNFTCLMVDEKLEVAIPVGFVHNKDFIRKVLVGKVGAAFCVTIRRELDRPNIACGMLGWIEIWEVSLGCCCCWFSLAFEDSIFDLFFQAKRLLNCLLLEFSQGYLFSKLLLEPDLKSNPSEDFLDTEVYSTALQLGLTNLAESSYFVPCRVCVGATVERAFKDIRSNKEGNNSR